MLNTVREGQVRTFVDPAEYLNLFGLVSSVATVVPTGQLIIWLIGVGVRGILTELTWNLEGFYSEDPYLGGISDCTSECHNYPQLLT